MRGVPGPAGRRKDQYLGNKREHKDSFTDLEISLRTWTYSTGLSSPASRLAMYLVAGKEFGVTFKSTRRRAFVIVMFEMVTDRQHCQRAFLCNMWRMGTLTFVLILEVQCSRIVNPASHVAHFDTLRSGHRCRQISVGVTMDKEREMAPLGEDERQAVCTAEDD